MYKTQQELHGEFIKSLDVFKKLSRSGDAGGGGLLWRMGGGTNNIHW